MPQNKRFAVLDGWRGLSILSVLACHMLPLGPKPWKLNVFAGYLGMSLFFVLSGFLITHTLYKNRSILVFCIRRAMRILPLAFIYLLVVFLIQHEPMSKLIVAMFFVQNYIYYAITPLTTHFWSLCVEVHFYIGIALLMSLTRFKGFKLIPVILVSIILLRIIQHVPFNIKTHLRVDEILSGACLALIYHNCFNDRYATIIKRVPWWCWLILLFLSCHVFCEPFMYFRSVFATCLIGHTLLTEREKEWHFLCRKELKYLAGISYALYIWHPLFMHGWLGSGDTFIRYLKRPFGIAFSFALAHISTYYYELPITRYGQALSKRLSRS